MKVVDLNGNTSRWNIKAGNDRVQRSDLHLQARQLLHTLFPSVSILEEVAVPILPYEQLYFDFFVPMLNLAIEVHGEQHYKYVPHFHYSSMQFMIQKKNDERKRQWCELNNITLVELPYNKQDKWETILKE